jgi:SNF2 family DNA or RNA helicase
LIVLPESLTNIHNVSVPQIATMAQNPSQHPRRKTTLVIAPLALLQQWESEIRKFVKDRWRVHVYHGRGAKITLAQMKTYDVIITTFGQVIGACSESKNTARPEASADNDSKKSGDLLEMKWYRVCVDEASQIRNSKTKAAQAVYRLKVSLCFGSSCSISGTE